MGPESLTRTGEKPDSFSRLGGQSAATEGKSSILGLEADREGGPLVHGLKPLQEASPNACGPC